MIRHKKVKGICYIYEVSETYRGRCETHNKDRNSTEAGDAK